MQCFEVHVLDIPSEIKSLVAVVIPIVLYGFKVWAFGSRKKLAYMEEAEKIMLEFIMS